ncbi:MAG: hypothetical protein Kow0047_04510 [Anaerolineae bacterium]
MLIDPDHPDLGPVNNQFVFLGGRVEHGRKELAKRFMYKSFGSTNFYLHTTICEQSHHIAYAEVTRNLKTGKSTTHMKPDILKAEYVIFFGTGAFEANSGPPSIAEKVTASLTQRKDFAMVVVDPRLSKTAAQADRWVPVKPGGDGALAMGMLRWIVENQRYDRTYLENPNPQAAAADGESTWTDATHLVRTDDMKFLAPEDIGLTPPQDGQPPFHVVMTDQGPALADEAPGGVLDFADELRGIPVKTAFTLLKERLLERSLEEYAELSGVDPRTIIELADEFTSHGKRAAAKFYRGPALHTNGYYNAQAIIFLNVLRRMWYPFSNEIYQEVIPSAADAYPYPIKAMLIHKGTPAGVIPAGDKQIPVLMDTQAIPLLIARDIVIGETTTYADYVLPDLTYMERWGTPHVSPDNLVEVSKVRQPMVAPIPEVVNVDGEEMPICLETFFIALGKRLGLPGFGKGGFGEKGDFDRPEDF